MNLDNIKVYTKGMGYELCTLLKERANINIDAEFKSTIESAPFIFIDSEEEGTARLVHDMNTFVKSPYIEMKVEELIEYLENRIQLSIGVPILVRRKLDDPWLLRKFRMLNLDASGNAVWVTSDGEKYNYCLPYKGNEGLLHK